MATTTDIAPSKDYVTYEGWVLKYCSSPVLYRHSFGGLLPAVEIGVARRHTMTALSRARMAIWMTHGVKASDQIDGPVSGFYNLSDAAGTWLAGRFVNFQEPLSKT